jgi:carbamoyl-phosphate synthase large subunit
VIEAATGRVAITAQNHGFVVEGEAGERFDTPLGAAIVSHHCPNDGTVEGLRCLETPAFSVQYHPEAAAGPHDAEPLFDAFTALMAGAGRVPKRTDIRHVLVIGSGPIVIGQACEFDYSCTQACRVLRDEGLRITLVNSNPATIMTDPEFADATYVEPITPEFVEQVIVRERPDALLATLGGQTALNCAVALHEAGVLERHDVELIGADVEAIRRGEDRQRFKDIVASVGAETPASRVCRSLAEAAAAAEELGLPLVIRPSFTMGGLGSGMAHTPEQLEEMVTAGLALSPVCKVLVEESVLGWKEYELELMRDRQDNVVVVCSIENVDPMGVHTGDSVTVAPAMTLSDREYQHMRDTAIAVLRAVGVDTGGCNIQFAVHSQTGRLVVIELNPRVSRSSALASKATGFPIAKIAAKLAIGYALDEIPNDITGETPASFEPTLDYVVVKVPRFAFEKFPDADAVLTTTMKSVGEAMAIGRSFTEALGKALRSVETPAAGFWTVPDPPMSDAASALADLRNPHDGRLYAVERALRLGATVAEVHEASGIDPWFVDQILALVELREEIVRARELGAELLRRAKRAGLSDRQLADLRGDAAGEDAVRELRERLGVRPVYKTVDTCAAEFAAATPYHYSAYEHDAEAESEVLSQSERRPKVLIIGSGPNRIGQGIEFDYSCVHAALALQSAGYEAVMVNCNPETVSTDYDISARLYFEPLTFEDIIEVFHAERESGPIAGAIVQLGGQTPLKLARRLAAAGVPVVGTPPDAIHRAENRGAFAELLTGAGLSAPRYGTASTRAEARAIADEIGCPVVVRPSYVLGGRGMEIVYDDLALSSYVERAAELDPAHPVLVDEFLEDAIEIDVDALCDGSEVYLGGVMEHIEEAGIHSGDSACVLPPITLLPADIESVRRSTELIAAGLGVRGLLNVQYALTDGRLYVLEANPRASRTIPFVSKATGVPLAKAGTRIMLGASIAELRAEGLLAPAGDATHRRPGATVAVKEAVLPFHRFRTAGDRGVDSVLGPEMRSTGEVMGMDTTFDLAFAKAQLASGNPLPTSGRLYVATVPKHLRRVASALRTAEGLGFEIEDAEDDSPDAAERLIASGQISLAVSIAGGGDDGETYRAIRAAAARHGVPYVTTITGLLAVLRAIRARAKLDLEVRSLQETRSPLMLVPAERTAREPVVQTTDHIRRAIGARN